MPGSVWRAARLTTSATAVDRRPGRLRPLGPKRRAVGDRPSRHDADLEGYRSEAHGPNLDVMRSGVEVERSVVLVDGAGEIPVDVDFRIALRHVDADATICLHADGAVAGRIWGGIRDAAIRRSGVGVRVGIGIRVWVGVGIAEREAE